MSDNSGYSIKGALFEAFFVVLGVILALTANEIRENYNAENKALEARQAIIEEIKSNQKAVSESIDYHKSIMDLLMHSMRTNSPPAPQAFQKGFIHAAAIFKTAYESAMLTSALNYLDYDEVLAISQIYAHQDRYENQVKTVGNVIYQTIFEKGTGGISENYTNLYAIVSTFYYRETQLKQLYTESLNKLSEKETEK